MMQHTHEGYTSAAEALIDQMNERAQSQLAAAQQQQQQSHHRFVSVAPAVAPSMASSHHQSGSTHSHTHSNTPDYYTPTHPLELQQLRAAQHAHSMLATSAAEYGMFSRSVAALPLTVASLGGHPAHTHYHRTTTDAHHAHYASSTGSAHAHMNASPYVNATPTAAAYASAAASMGLTAQRFHRNDSSSSSTTPGGAMRTAAHQYVTTMIPATNNNTTTANPALPHASSYAYSRNAAGVNTTSSSSSSPFGYNHPAYEALQPLDASNLATTMQAGICPARKRKRDMRSDNNGTLDLTPVKERKVQGTVSMCCICFDNEVSHVMIPCGHPCICKDCAKVDLRECPICRSHVIRSIRFYGTLVEEETIKVVNEDGGGNVSK